MPKQIKLSQFKIARSMLREGIDYQTISDLTKISVSTVSRLCQSMKEELKECKQKRIKRALEASRQNIEFMERFKCK